MPTFPKRPPVAPAPLLPEEFGFEAEGGADDFLKPSEFGNGGYYDNNEEAAIRHAARRPKAFSLNHEVTLMQHQENIQKAKERPQKATPAKKRVVRSQPKPAPAPAPVPIPQPVVREREEFIDHVRSREPSPMETMTRSHSRTGKEVYNVGRESNFNDIKHMMQVGSSQNRQVTHWASSFREMSEETAPRHKPLWNLNTRNAAWKSLEDIHSTEPRPRRQVRRSSIPASLKKSYDDARYEPIVRSDSGYGGQAELNLSGSFVSSVASSTTSSIREQLSLTKSRLQASLGSSLSHTEQYSPQFPTATTW